VEVQSGCLPNPLFILIIIYFNNCEQKLIKKGKKLRITVTLAPTLGQ
jgi:hypothetical protein